MEGGREGGRKTVIGVWGSWKFGEEMLDDAVHLTGETEMDWAFGFGHWALGIGLRSVGCRLWAFF